MTKYVPDAHFSEANRPLFAFASCNAGPGNIAKMRREAQKRGLDPDKWLNYVRRQSNGRSRQLTRLRVITSSSR
jgi:membrane-bound lytic murein transglycosylase MltF